MAILQEQGGQRQLRLRARTRVGRAADADLVIDDRRVSADHAHIRWNGRSWELRDLGSRNGTRVDGQALGAGDARALVEGELLCFGGPDLAWRLQSASAPTLVAVCGELEREAVGQLLALPDDEHPVVSLYLGEDASWLVEEEMGLRPVLDRELLAVGTEQWQVHLPGAFAGTWKAEQDAPPTPDELALRFVVSRDEEHVELTAQSGSRAIDLGARAHHYLLLTLARLRLADQANDELPATAHGWVHQEELARMLRMDDNALYVSIHRARRQLADAGVSRAADLVERRVGTRQLRLGIASIETAVI